METVVSYKMWQKIVVLNFAIAYRGVICKMRNWYVLEAASIHSGLNTYVAQESRMVLEHGIR